MNPRETPPHQTMLPNRTTFTEGRPRRRGRRRGNSAWLYGIILLVAMAGGFAVRYFMTQPQAGPSEPDPVARKTPLDLALTQGRFDKALDGRHARADILLTSEYLKTPFTVDLWIRGLDVASENVILACHHSDSPAHWQLATQPETGFLQLTLGGQSVVSEKNLVDDEWHFVSLMGDGMELRMFLDAEDIGAVSSPSIPGAGPLWVAHAPTGEERASNALIDELRFSRGKTRPSSVPGVPFAFQNSTLGLWHFDRLQGQDAPDLGTESNPALVRPRQNQPQVD